MQGVKEKREDDARAKQGKPSSKRSPLGHM
jgi:hypothetical protein